jgi:hypothetical protein
VFKSHGGEAWSQVPTGVYGNKVFGIAIDPVESSTVCWAPSPPVC